MYSSTCNIESICASEEDGEIGVLAISHMSLCYRVLETLVGHVKGLIAAAFKSSKLLHLLTINGRVGAMPTYRVY